MIFLFGIPQKDQSEGMDLDFLEMENKENKDTIQGSFPDAFRYLTHKWLLGTLWINKHCKRRKPKYLLKIDDDSGINFENLLNYLSYQDPDERAIYCPSVLRNHIIWRFKEAPILGKWGYQNDNYTSKIFLKRIIIFLVANLYKQESTIQISVMELCG